MSAPRRAWILLVPLRRGPGEETPDFVVDLLVDDVRAARVESRGTGGCAVVRWTDAAGLGSALRASATAWLAAEAARIWRSDPELGEPSERLSVPEEAAIIVVPEHLDVASEARAAEHRLAAIAKTRRPTDEECAEAGRAWARAAALVTRAPS